MANIKERKSRGSNHGIGPTVPMVRSITTSPPHLSKVVSPLVRTVKRTRGQCFNHPRFARGLYSTIALRKPMGIRTPHALQYWHYGRPGGSESAVQRDSIFDFRAYFPGRFFTESNLTLSHTSEAHTVSTWPHVEDLLADEMEGGDISGFISSPSVVTRAGITAKNALADNWRLR